MLDPGPRRSRAGLRLAAFTVASLVLLLASGTAPARYLQEATGRILEPARALVAGAGTSVSGMIDTVAEIGGLRSDNERLRSALAVAELRIAALQPAAAENAELRQLLGLTATLDMDLLPVRILSRDPGNFTWEVGIDAGRHQGVQVGMPVVASAAGAGALAGAVVAVGADTATVRLVFDTRSSVVAIDQQTQTLGLVQGRLGGQMVMLQVPVTDAVAVGDMIVSAGLVLGGATDDSVRSPYPPGLLIGVVQAIQVDQNAVTRTVYLRPAVDFSTIDRMLLVLRFGGDRAPTPSP